MVDDRAAAAAIRTALELVAIDSPSGHEVAICDHVAARLERSVPGAMIQRIGHSLVVAPRPPRPGRATVALLGHLDTVPPYQDGPARIEGDRLVGCGASDMKAGLAVIITLVERLDLDALGVDLLAVFYEREEGPYEENGLGPLIEASQELRTVDLALCLEPSDNRLQLGSLGGIHCTLTFSGLRAHSARPWEGENAVHKAGPLLAELLAMEPRPVAFAPPPGTELAELTFFEVMNVTAIMNAAGRAGLGGGGAHNVIPDQFALNLNYRFAPGRSIEAAQADIDAIVAGRASIAWTDLSPSGRVCLDNPLLRPLLGNPNVSVEAKQAWTDVARLSHYGVDAVNLGPGESAQAHQRNESCALDRIADGYRLFERYLTAL